MLDAFMTKIMATEVTFNIFLIHCHFYSVVMLSINRCKANTPTL